MTAGPGRAPSTPERRPLLRVLRGAPRPVWVLVIGVLINRTGSFFSLFIVLFLADRGVRPAQLPPVLLAVAGAGMFGSLAGGWLADRVGRRTTLVGSMAAAGLSLAALPLASEGPQLVLAACAVALFTQSYVPAASALLVDQCAPEDRVPVFALFRLALNVGAAIGPLLAAALVAESYTALFLVDGGTCLLFAALLALGLPSTGRRSHLAKPSARRVPDPSLPGGPRPGAALRVLFVALFLVALVYAQYSSTLPLRLAADGMSARFYGALVAFNAVLVIALELPLSAVTRRLGVRGPLTLGAVLIGGGMALSGSVPPRGLVVASVAVWSLGEMLLAPVAGAAVAALSPPEKVARYQGVLATAQTLGFSVGPALGTFALVRSPALPWIGCLVTGGLAVLLLQVALSPAPSSPIVAPKRNPDAEPVRP